MLQILELPACHQDADLLLSVLHPDMVWPWPPRPDAHDPMHWVIEWGRHDAARWRQGWQRLFDTHALVHNRRVTRQIAVSGRWSTRTPAADLSGVTRIPEV